MLEFVCLTLVAKFSASVPLRFYKELCVQIHLIV